MPEIKPTAFRIKPAEQAKLDEMAEASGRTKTAIVEDAIALLYERHVEAVREGRERVKRATELLAELRRRLGDDLRIGTGQGIGFSDSGPIAVEVGDTAYVHTDDGTIVATRMAKGRHEMAVVSESGLSEWMPPLPSRSWHRRETGRGAGHGREAPTNT